MARISWIAMIALIVLGGARAWGQDFPAAGPAVAGGPAGGDKPVAISTAWSADGVMPGEQVNLAVIFDIDDNWHLQLHEPELDWLVATEIDVEGLPAGVVIGDVQWPEPHPIEVNFTGEPQTLHFYTGEAVVYLKVSVGEAVEPGEYGLKVATTWQACDDKSCLPPETTANEITLNVVPPGAAVETTNEGLFADYRGVGGGGLNTLAIPFFGWDFEIDPTALWLLLIVAAAGGFLLNLTPCVLPMIPIKIMGLSQAAGNRSRCLLLGVVMGMGVVAFWLALGGGIAATTALAADADAFGIRSTNELFQYPLFTITVGVIIAAMAVGMCGLFTMQLPQWVYRINPSHDTLHGSFGFGIMAAVLSTPCTAPFMGAAAAWAATQNSAVTLATFAAIGFGMAMPYVVLSAFPALIEKMPRTGPASELIKQVMGLLLLAAAAYFIGTGISGMAVDPPDPPSRAYWWAVAACIAAAGVWLAWRTIRITPAAGRRAIFVGLGALFLAASVWIGTRFTDRGPIDWVYYTPERLEHAEQRGQVVVLEFTAEWCLNCKALEQAVLHDDRVVDRIRQPGVTPIKVDITGNNRPGNQKLLEVGRRTIPLLIVYSPDGQEVFKSDAYTVTQVLDALERARPATAARDDVLR